VPTTNASTPVANIPGLPTRKRYFRIWLPRDSSRPTGAGILWAVLRSRPGPGSFTCPPGQTLVGPTNVSYTNIVLTDLTSGATISLGSAS
jgi:hypothetical protein